MDMIVKVMMDGKIPVIIKLDVWNRAQALYNAGERTLKYGATVARELIAAGVLPSHAYEVSVLARTSKGN